MHFWNQQGVSFRVVCFVCFEPSDPFQRTVLPPPRVGHRAGLDAGVRQSTADLPPGGGHVTEDWAGRPGRGEAVVVCCLPGTHMCKSDSAIKYYNWIQVPTEQDIYTYLPISNYAERPGKSTLGRACDGHQITDRLQDLRQGKSGCVSGGPSFHNPPAITKLILFLCAPLTTPYRWPTLRKQR